MQLLNAQEPYPSPNLCRPRGPNSALWQACWPNAACCSFEANALAPDLHWHKRHLGTNKGEVLQDALQDNFPESLSEKKSHDRQDPIMLGQSTRLPLSSAWLGRSSILPNVLTSVEKKSAPSLFSLSCSARQTPLSGVVSQRRLSVSGAAKGWGAAGQKSKGLRRQLLTPAFCLSPRAGGQGELRARSKWDWGQRLQRRSCFPLTDRFS